MVKTKSQEQAREPIKDQAPREPYLITKHHLHHTGYHDEQPFAHHECKTIEDAPNKDNVIAVVVLKSALEKAIDGNVVGGTTKSY